MSRKLVRWCITFGIATPLIFFGGVTSVVSAEEAKSPTFAIDVSSQDFSQSVSGQPIVTTAIASGRSNEFRGAPIVVLKSDDEVAVASGTLLLDDIYSQRAFWAAGDGFVDLSWADVAVDEGYRVYQDDVLRAEVVEPFIRLSDIDPGFHRLTVKTSIPIPRTEWDPQDVAAFEKSGVMPRSGYIWSMNTVVPDGNSLDAAEQARLSLGEYLLNVSYSSLRYRTFIRDEYVTSPPYTCAYAWPYFVYGGDNRGFNSNASTYRTSMVFQVNWSPDAFYYAYDVGTTHVYTADTHALVDAQTASMSGMDMWPINGDAGLRVKMGGEFDVGNPFCSVGSVAGDYLATLTSDGNVSISGSHRAVPDHEIYLVTSSGTTIIHQSQVASLTCLVEIACGRVPIS